MNAFDKFLQDNIGQVVVRKVWTNTNSTKNQCTIQFAVAVNRNTIPQEFFKNDSAGNNGAPLNKLVASVQAGVNTIMTFTALLSANIDMVQDVLGSVNKDWSGETEGFIKAEEVFDAALFEDGTRVVLNAWRCTKANPYASSQSPVVNPTNGQVMTLNGKNLYLHTTVDVGTQHTFTFGGDALAPWIRQPQTVEVTEAADVLSELGLV